MDVLPASGFRVGSSITTQETFAAGGLVGYSTGTIGTTANGTPAGCYATDAVTVTSGSDDYFPGGLDISSAGGLVGLNYGNITYSYSTGPVTVNADFWCVGGLVGQNKGSITDSYSTSPVSATDLIDYHGNLVGGFVALNYASITDCYSAGAVTSSGGGMFSAYVGGFTGLDLGSSSSCYWDIDTSGQQNGGSSGATGLSASGSSPYAASSYSGWNIADTSSNLSSYSPYTWVIVNGSTLPFLQSEYSTTIASAHQLQLIAENPAANYTLTANIDLTDDIMAANGWLPIGSSAAPFTGTFNGNGYNINGLAITDATSSAVGLFGYTGKAAQINNVGLSNVSIVSSAPNASVGALVGNNDGSISEVFTAGTVSATGSGSAAGGLVGLNGADGSITSSYSSAVVSGPGNAGGLAGTNQGSIANCFYAAAGTVSGTAATSNTGGLAGENSGTILTSYSAGTVNGGGTSTGGLVGLNDATGIITSAVWDTDNGGQLTNSVGVDNNSTVTSVTNMTTAQMGVAANYPTGWDFTSTWDIVGGSPILKWELNNIGYITNIYQLELINSNLSGVYTLGANIDLSSDSSWAPLGSASSPFSGILIGNGYTISGLTINDATSTDIGLFGATQGASISGVKLTDVTITTGSTGTIGAASADIGGLVGDSGNGTKITNCSTITGSITVTGANATVGGLVGYNGGTITNSANAVTVTAESGTGSSTTGIGGLAGVNAATGSIIGSANTGAVTAGGDTSNVGGLAGYNAGSITSSTNTAAVKASGSASYIGGLVGWNATGGSITGTTQNLSENAGAVEADGSGSWVGGLAGINQGSITNAYSAALYNTANVLIPTVTSTGDGNYVGGLMGKTTVASRAFITAAL